MGYSRDASYRDRSAHRHHARRRVAKKVSLLLLVLGLLCVILSVMLFGISYLYRADHHQRQLYFSLGYFLAGVILLLLRWLMEIIRAKTHGNYQPGVRTRAMMAERGLSEHAEPPQTAVPPRSDPRSGSALVMVLAALALIAGLVIETQLSARAALRREQALLLKGRLQQAATDAAWNALRGLADDEDLSVDHTNKSWATVTDLKDPAGIDTRVTITDEDRRFDLNNLSLPRAREGARSAADIAMDILTMCGDFSPVDRIDALMDWVDSDDEGFGESRVYLERKPPYKAANRALHAWTELLLVNGFTREYFMPHERTSALELYSANPMDCLTVLPPRQGGPNLINVNTAPKEVLMGVFGPSYDGLVGGILAKRDLVPIRSIEAAFTVTDPFVLEVAHTWLAVRSRFFSVDAQAYADGRTERLRALAQRGPQGDVKVLQWVLL